MTEIDLSLIRSYLIGVEPQGRTALIPALHKAQELYGYLSEDVSAEVSRALNVPLAEVHGVIDFYALFTRDAHTKKTIQVCRDPACALAGADQLMANLSQSFNGSGEAEVKEVPCLGLCDQAPAALVGETPFVHADRVAPADLLTGKAPESRSFVGGDLSVLTANCRRGRSTSLAEYEASGGYAGLKKALALKPAEVVAEVKASGLVGRGGAAFPTGVKWEGAAQASGEPKYVVCNADESEPGTFKDRVLMENDPHRVLEGMLIAGYAIGAHYGYVYIRGEYPTAYRVMEAAVQEARQAGTLGPNVRGSGFSFDLELRRGAGAYICGEETSLFESIEGKRGFPRMKPPFPTTHGLFGKPTVINNVETLCNVPYILEQGAAGYRRLGTEKSPGPKLFCVSGDVERPGLYEVPFGVTLRHLLFDLAGGMRQVKPLQAVLFGGAAGAFATPQDLDVKLSFEDLRAAGLPLGSGVVMVFDESRDLRDVLLRLTNFFAEESCGKCYPCQMGTQRQYEILQRVAQGKPMAGDTERLSDVGWTMTDASLCGLGQTAGSAVLSALKLWPEMFQAEGKVV